MKTPPSLKKGDRVGVICTAKRTDPGEITQGLELLKTWNLEPVLGKHLYSTHGFFAGTDAERTEDLQQMLDDDSIKAIIFAKGAYGTLRIADDINFTRFAEKPKWITGYSDITVLHLRVHQLGIESIHSVMLQGMATANFTTTETMRAALFGESLHYTIPKHPRNREGRNVSGTLIGGNLSMLYSILDSEVDTFNKLLFFEDIDEYLYHLDRMMVTLKRRGKLAHLKGILVGGLTEIKESTIPFGQNEYDIILQHTAEYDYPVYFGFPAGHVPDNRALILGRKVNINTVGDAVEVDFEN